MRKKKTRKLFIKFLKWKYQHISNKQFTNIASAIIGLLSGLAAVIIKNATHFIQQLLEGEFIKEIHNAFYFIFPILGLFLVILIVKYLIKKKISPGIPATLYAISKRKGLMKRHQIWSSLFTAPITVGFGGSVGLEAPTVVTGAALASSFSKIFHLNQTTRTLLIGAAAAGSMASIFKAPIAAIVFAVEVFSLELTMASMIPLLLASITSVLTSYFFFGDQVLLHFKLQDKFLLEDVLFYILLGGATALISVYFSKVYFLFANYFKKITTAYKRLLIGGLLLGVLVYFVPPLFGEGYEVINNILRGNISAVVVNNIFDKAPIDLVITIGLLVGLILFKIVATSLTIEAGGVGGVFAPTLFTGSITGYVLATIVNATHLFNHQLSSTNFAMVGMAGLIAGVLHSPLTAIFMIAEITGGYELFIPLMIVASISYIITKKYIPHTIYASELAKKGELVTHDKDKNVLLFLDIDKVIEKDFLEIHPTMSLGVLLKEKVTQSKRNIYPVLNKHQEFLGIVLLDDIRPIMFDQELYETTTVSDLMKSAPTIIQYTESMENIMQKFKSTGAWNLPVIRNNKYVGFISKSKLLTAYRNKLIEVTS